MHNAAPILPRGWDIGPLPQAQLDAPFPWVLREGQPLYIHNNIIALTVLGERTVPLLLRGCGQGRGQFPVLVLEPFDRGQEISRLLLVVLLNLFQLLEETNR